MQEGDTAVCTDRGEVSYSEFVDGCWKLQGEANCVCVCVTCEVLRRSPESRGDSHLPKSDLTWRHAVVWLRCAKARSLDMKILQLELWPESCSCMSE